MPQAPVVLTSWIQGNIFSLTHVFRCDGEVGTVGDRRLYVNKYMGIHVAWCEGKSTIRGIQFTSSNFLKWVSSYYCCCAVYSWLGGLPVDSNSHISNSHLNIGVL